MVARRLLPASPSYLLDRHDRVITGARPRVVSRHVGRTRRRNHDGRATRTGSLVEADRLVGGIRRHPSEGVVDRLDQRDASRRVVDTRLRRQGPGDDHARSVDTEMPLVPASTDFSLPAELLFIGTMNTADRSIRSIDIALRRRFDVFECLPDGDILERFFADRTHEVSNLVDGFRALNEELQKQLDKHHTVGHTFFMHDPLTRTRLDQIWERKIGPLIEEYFFDQPDLAEQFNRQRFWPDS